ncbi:MAG: adenosylcobinamide amidohydrolase [Halodesulfurarchaeum sp.]
MTFSTSISGGVLALSREQTRWLSTGHDGGYSTAESAYNVSVPESFERTDLQSYRKERLTEAGFEVEGPTLFTGVDMRHARGARTDPVLAVATVGLSNPAALPVASIDHVETTEDERDRLTVSDAQQEDGEERKASDPHPGTVNVLLGTTEPLSDGGLAGLLGTVVEAKTATLLGLSGFPGTTTDAVVVGCPVMGAGSAFAGSATRLGSAARAAVRDAIRASFESRYHDREVPETVEDAEYGVSTDRMTAVFDP